MPSEKKRKNTRRPVERANVSFSPERNARNPTNYRYRLAEVVTENHGMPIFAMQFNNTYKRSWELAKPDGSFEMELATVGSNCLTIYVVKLSKITVKPERTLANPNPIHNQSQSQSQQQIPASSTNVSISQNNTEHSEATSLGSSAKVSLFVQVKPVRHWRDADPDESFYAVAWSIDESTLRPLIAIAGKHGVIRILNAAGSFGEPSFVRDLRGHGASVNALRFVRSSPSLLFSFAKDLTARLWNVATGCQIAVFGGDDAGHRSEVLHGDVDDTGTLLVTCSMDDSVRVWRLDTNSALRRAVAESYTHSAAVKGKQLRAVHVSVPDFVARDVHAYYVDCVALFGDLILSKACSQNEIVLWKTGSLDQLTAKRRPIPTAERIQQLALDDSAKRAEKPSAEMVSHEENETGTTATVSAEQISILHRFQFDATEEWFVRFGLSESMNTLVVSSGRAHVVAFDWTNANSPSDALVSLIPLPQRTAAIVRQALVVGPHDELLVAACDTGTLHFFVKDFRTPPRTDAPAFGSCGNSVPLAVRASSIPNASDQNHVSRPQMTG